MTEQVIRQERVGQFEQPGEYLPLLGRCRRQVCPGKPPEKNIQLLHPPATAPQEAAALRIQRVRRGSAQDWRSSIIFLISAMALAGFKSLGQTSVQFMIV
jgi:hypothetical protein